MRPTIEEQLRGVERLLKDVADDRSLSEESATLLRDAQKQLRRVAGSADAREAFLGWDNQETRMLLDGLLPLLPDDVETAVSAGDLASTNEELRRLLCRAVDELPNDEHGEAGRRRIVDHLLTRVDANPLLNKTPTTPSGAAYRAPT
jgi:hypothetical protein